MLKNIEKIRKYMVYIYTSLLFLLSIIVFVYIFPKEKQSGYEYVEGEVWLYDDLIAQKDCPIQKTEEELFTEANNLKENFVPFYAFDTLTAQKTVANFTNEIDYIKLHHFSAKDDIEHIDNFKNLALKLINRTYKNGIIEPSDSSKNMVDKRIKVNKQGVYTMSFASDFLTPDSLRTILFQLYQKINPLDSVCNFELQNQISLLKIAPNVCFDEQTSSEFLDNQIKELSKYSGMIKEGETIIKKGDKISHNQFKKINSALSAENTDIYNTNNTQNKIVITLGIIILFFGIYYVVFFLYFYIYKKEILFRLRNNTFFTFQFLCIILLIFVMLNVNYFEIFTLNVIPFTLFAAILISFFDFSISFFVYFFIILLSCFFAPNGFEFIFTQSIAGMVCMYSLRRKQKRQQVFVAMLCVFTCYFLLYFGFFLMRGNEITFKNFFSNHFYSYLLSGGLLLLYLPLVFIYEKIFGFLSDFTLNELSDTNSPLLKELSEKAPGTFQHSWQVANLVEAVVRELNGDVLLARTGALYHDIGKISNPEYFIENQYDKNIHDSLAFDVSAKTIINHVEVGLKIADLHFLPQHIKNFIRTHHGSTITRYFYNSWRNQNPDKIPDMKHFQYRGPKPKTLETSVLMMADAIEAASRTIKEYTPATIQNMVNNIIDNLIANEQFDEVDITLKQITIAKQIFIKKVINIYHSRIVYPELKNI